MGALTTAIELLSSSRLVQAFTTIALLLLYPLAQGIYNIYFHPLAGFKGPRAWSASRLPFVYNLLSGSLIQRQRQLHEQYGPVVRIAPDEISFANEQAWHDIYAWRKGHKRAFRDPAFHVAPPGQADNLITTSDFKFHARVRGLMSHSFTDASLTDQSQLIEGHADMLIHQLSRGARDHSNESQGSLVNFTDWLNFFTMDVIGDLAFGEAFGCLALGDYHEWVRTLYNYLKYMTIAAVPRYWPFLQFILEKLVPQKVLDGQASHQAYAYSRINRRLDFKSDRPDFMTPFMKKNPNFENMSREEILSTFSFIIVGGSETTATTMTGMFNNLCMAKHKHILDRLVQEIRGAYQTEQDITLERVKTGSLPYMEAVLSESLRVCHPVPSGLPRMVPAGGDEYGGVFLPEGTRVGVRIFAVNRSAKYFHNPDSFVPERWLSPDERPAEYANDFLAASKPFSIGFHSCLGQPLAWLELRLILTRMLWAFDLSEEKGREVEFDKFPMLMMVEKQPVWLRVKLRDGVEYKGVSDRHPR